MSQVAETIFDALVIDDDAAVREFVVSALRRAGYSVRSADNGRTAMAELLRYEFRLVITDIYMPEMDGIEVIIQSLALRPDIPVLAMTGGGMAGGPWETLRPARQLGCRRTIAKPFEIPEFLGLVAELLRGSFSRNTSDPKL